MLKFEYSKQLKETMNTHSMSHFSYCITEIFCSNSIVVGTLIGCVFPTILLFEVFLYI